MIKCFFFLLWHDDYIWVGKVVLVKLLVPRRPHGPVWSVTPCCALRSDSVAKTGIRSIQIFRNEYFDIILVPGDLGLDNGV
jgi:hypothetical protein